MNKKFFIPIALMATLYACNGNSGEKKTATTNNNAPVQSTPATSNTPKATAATAPVTDSVSDIKEIPILCYHQIRDWKSTDSKYQQVYIVPLAKFKDQIQTLRDSGYHAVLPDQLIAHMVNGAKLPSKPIMLTFDDGPQSQIDNALPELDKAGFKAVFFIMTVVLGHKDYVTADEVKKLFDQGHVIGCHTWNHTMVTKYKTDADYKLQIDKPKALLEKITGQPIKYFAYPYGLWNEAAVQYVKKAGFAAAFQLVSNKESKEKLFIIRRLIANPNWSGQQLLKNIRRYQ